jgi:hypothetical protein
MLPTNPGSDPRRVRIADLPNETLRPSEELLRLLAGDWIDAPLLPLLEALNRAGAGTFASCAAHVDQPGDAYILFANASRRALAAAHALAAVLPSSRLSFSSVPYVRISVHWGGQVHWNARDINTLDRAAAKAIAAVVQLPARDARDEDECDEAKTSRAIAAEHGVGAELVVTGIDWTTSGAVLRWESYSDTYETLAKGMLSLS